jgi:hypothetical protein
MTSFVDGLEVVRAWCFRLGMLGLVVLLGRGGWLVLQSTASWSESTNRSSSSLAEASPLLSPSAIQRLLTPHAPLPSNFLDPHAPPAPSLVERTIHVYLVVTAAPDRSEVLVNGVVLGQAPFVGEISCRVSSELSIAALPPQGMPLRWSRPCVGQSIHIE